jgi:hypothetical protein
MRFLLNHPRWTWDTFIQTVPVAFSENRQPFFTTDTEITPNALMYLNGLLHPTTPGVILANVVQLVVFAIQAWKLGAKASIGVASILGVFFLGEILMLFISVHGDALGIIRHSLGSVMPLRLFVWLLPAFILDAFSRLTARQMLN